MNRSFSDRLTQALRGINPGTAFIALILGALIAFEMFNYSTTDHALQDLLGMLEFGGMRWSTILALAFCGIDFAGIARLFTPEQGMDEPKEVWYLFGAWLLAATMNAVLTWWGVSMAITNHQVQSASVIDPKLISTVVPVFVAIMVWVIRILIIGTLSMAMDRLLHNGARRGRVVGSRPLAQPSLPVRQMNTNPGINTSRTLPRAAAPANTNTYGRQASDYNNRANAQTAETARGFAEPTYHSLNAAPRENAAPRSASFNGGNSNTRR
jgi:hypothetical protein